LLAAAVADFPISGRQLCEVIGVHRRKDHWLAARRKVAATVPPMFPIPMIAVVMSVLLEGSH